MEKQQGFVKFIIAVCQKDKGKAALFKKADNETFEHESWEILNRFIDIENKDIRSIYALTLASIAKSKIENDGFRGLGSALATCYDEMNNSDQAKTKLRRILECDSYEDIINVFRPILSLIRSRSNNLNYAQLLFDLEFFATRKDKVRAYWAKDFYNHVQSQQHEEAL